MSDARDPDQVMRMRWAELEAERDRLRAALEEERDRHHEARGDGVHWCQECNAVFWPCPTRRRLDAVLNETEQED